MKNGTVQSEDLECLHCDSDCKEYLGVYPQSDCPASADPDDCSTFNGGCGITCTSTATSDCDDLFPLCQAQE